MWDLDIRIGGRAGLVLRADSCLAILSGYLPTPDFHIVIIPNSFLLPLPFDGQISHRFVGAKGSVLFEDLLPRLSSNRRSASSRRLDPFDAAQGNIHTLMAPQKVTLSLPPKVGREPGTKPVG